MVETSVGYTGGSSPNPTYGSVCNGDGHTEAIKVSYDPSKVSYNQLLKVSHHAALADLLTHHKILSSSCVRVFDTAAETAAESQGGDCRNPLHMAVLVRVCRQISECFV